ncbi:unnamed protein product [Phytophthora fragariaefolia]|uniref:Unnamed protein product n=1 Tax=Phytophthora fragariaefolia TaxID=1490495 RepID=A0A9W6XSY3_9STRA|nr:unnamed protein product [Phytophthora fragariaefolia]
MLDVCYTQLVTRSIKVLTRHSTLAWMLNSSGLQGRLGRWATFLSNWTLEIVKCTKGEDEILGTIVASITPLENVDSILTSIAHMKQPRQVVSIPPPTVEPDEELLVVSFDGYARVKRSGGAFSAIVWSLPNWTVISGASEYKTSLTVNEAEYHGLLLCFDLLAKQHVGQNRLIICGDSNLSQISVVKIAATTRSRQRRNQEVLLEPLVQRMRMERICRAQDEEEWIAYLKQYLTGDVRELTSTEAKSCAKIAEDYEVDEAGVLCYCPPSKQSCGDRDLVTRLEDQQKELEKLRCDGGNTLTIYLYAESEVWASPALQWKPVNSDHFVLSKDKTSISVLRPGVYAFGVLVNHLPHEVHTGGSISLRKSNKLLQCAGTGSACYQSNYGSKYCSHATSTSLMCIAQVETN